LEVLEFVDELLPDPGIVEVTIIFLGVVPFVAKQKYLTSDPVDELNCPLPSSGSRVHV
jgi:hypothetical protein